MTTLFVPYVGSILTLLEPWDFTLYAESRNDSLMEFLKPEVYEQFFSTNSPFGYNARLESGQGYNRPFKQFEVGLPKGTQLVVERVYVRVNNKDKTGPEDYDSLTFRMLSFPAVELKKKPRFWAKLDDCNRIEFELETPSQKSQLPKKTSKKTIESIRREINEHAHNLVIYYELNSSSISAWATDFATKVHSTFDSIVNLRDSHMKNVELTRVLNHFLHSTPETQRVDGKLVRKFSYSPPFSSLSTSYNVKNVMVVTMSSDESEIESVEFV